MSRDLPFDLEPDGLRAQLEDLARQVAALSPTASATEIRRIRDQALDLHSALLNAQAPDELESRCRNLLRELALAEQAESTRDAERPRYRVFEISPPPPRADENRPKPERRRGVGSLARRFFATEFGKTVSALASLAGIGCVIVGVIWLLLSLVGHYAGRPSAVRVAAESARKTESAPAHRRETVERKVTRTPTADSRPLVRPPAPAKEYSPPPSYPTVVETSRSASASTSAAPPLRAPASPGVITSDSRLRSSPPVYLDPPYAGGYVPSPGTKVRVDGPLYRGPTTTGGFVY